MRHAVRRAAFLGAVAVVLAPAWTGTTSVPLSDYPIYAQARARVSTITTARGIDAAGRWIELGAATIASTDDPLIAQARLDDGVRSDPSALCRSILARADGDVVAVEVARERHDLVAHVRGDESLLDREVLARCEATR